METRPVTIILRLWQRSEALVSEVRQLHEDKPRYFKSMKDLVDYMESLVEREGVEKEET